MWLTGISICIMMLGNWPTAFYSLLAVFGAVLIHKGEKQDAVIGFHTSKPTSPGGCRSSRRVIFSDGLLTVVTVFLVGDGRQFKGRRAICRMMDALSLP